MWSQIADHDFNNVLDPGLIDPPPPLPPSLVVPIPVSRNNIILILIYSQKVRYQNVK